MKPEQLKLLAEWYGYKESSKGWYWHPDKEHYTIEKADWQPHKDSNQLDMLKLKYIKEAKIGEAKTNYRSDGIRLIVRSVDVINTDTAFEESENECWLEIILNYVESK